MRVIDDNLWFCADCTIVAVNDDYSGIEDEARCKAVRAAVHAMGPHLASNSSEDEGHDEFSWSACDCCGSCLGGSRDRFALLAPDDAVEYKCGDPRNGAPECQDQ